MKRVYLTIFAVFWLLIICSACVSGESNNNNGNRASCVRSGNKIYCEEMHEPVDGNNVFIYSISSDGEKTSLASTNMFSDIYLLDENLYYLKDKDNLAMLCAINVNEKSTSVEIGNLGERKSVKTGAYNGCEFYLFKINDLLCALYNYNIYVIGNEIEKAAENIISVCCDDAYVYFSTFDGTVNKYDMKNNTIEIILKKDCLAAAAGMWVFGSNSEANDILAYNGKLYYIGSGDLYGKGALYVYDPQAKDVPMPLTETIDKFTIYQDKIIYLQKKNIYGIDLITNEEFEIINEGNIIDFYIDGARLYVLKREDNGECLWQVSQKLTVKNN